MTRLPTPTPTRLALLLATSLLASAATAQTNRACTQLIASGNPEYPPFLWVAPDDDKALHGANAELMQLLSREIGIPIVMRNAGPWARVQEAAKAGRIDLIAGAFYTLPRRLYMSYIQTPFYQTRSAVWMRENKAPAYGKWADLVGRNGITVVNNSFGEEFDRFAELRLTMQTVGSVENAMRMLSMGRADYLIYEEAPGQAYANKLGIRNIRVAGTPVSREPLYLTLTHQSPCFSPQLYDRLNKALKKLVDSNVMDQLVASHSERWQALQQGLLEIR
ncbi:substrate-binding periplasmic protein [Vogesella mureinivorans]|uniref:substrate-binding periplasmic protein n=1 Tax=Vogesella mureinivorans TaxID=657276 RepID=UPI0011C6E9D5|nr:transporter substrate-binding domain-containing protein [Vogesella mureinivorans]